MNRCPEYPANKPIPYNLFIDNSIVRCYNKENEYKGSRCRTFYANGSDEKGNR